MTDPRRYRAFLLRLWRIDDQQGRQVWRAALEDARTGERHGFADLERLCAFLEARSAMWAEASLRAPDHNREESA